MASVRRDRVCVVVVGCGDIAENAHLPAIDRSGDVELVGVVDVNEAARTRLARRYGDPAAATVAQALEWRPDAAIVATPPEVTPRLTVELVRGGVHVLCEKPIAVDLHAARLVHETALASSRVVQVGFVNRFSPVIEQVHEWIRDGRLGHPLVFTLSTYDERYDPEDDAHTARILHFLRHGAAFLHEAAHQTDHVLRLGGGSPVAVNAIGLRTRPEFANDNYTAALVRFDNGNVARFEVAWMFPVLPPNDFRVVGPHGTVQVNRVQGWATLVSIEGEQRFQMSDPWVETAFDRQLAAFVAAIRGGKRLGPDTSDGLASLALCRDVVAATESREVRHAVR